MTHRRGQTRLILWPNSGAPRCLTHQRWRFKSRHLASTRQRMETFRARHRFLSLTGEWAHLANRRAEGAADAR